MSSSPLTFELDPHHLPVNISIVKFIFETPKLGGILIIHLKMVNGWNYLELAQATENDERCSGVTNAILVDKQLEESNKISITTKEVIIFVVNFVLEKAGCIKIN